MCNSLVEGILSFPFYLSFDARPTGKVAGKSPTFRQIARFRLSLGRMAWIIRKQLALSPEINPRSARSFQFPRYLEITVPAACVGRPDPTNS
jgi:hypothetical protein